MSKFQERYDAIRDESSRLAARNPGAFARLSDLGKRAILVAREAEKAGQPVVRRPKGWTK